MWRLYGAKWVNKYVSEDKNGNVRYKGSKDDKWSGEYYDNKTGKWTGKQYDGEAASPRPSLSNSEVGAGCKQ